MGNYEFGEMVKMEGNFILPAVLVFMWMTHLWDTYLSWRQRQIFKYSLKVPSEVESIMDQETFEKARIYNLDKKNFGLIQGVFVLVESTLILVFGILPYLWDVTVDIMGRFGYSEEYEISCSVVFALIGAFLSTILSMPWTLYSTFVIEEKHGFNKQTLGFFIKDQIKQFIVFQLISLVVLSGLLYIIRMGGDLFFLYCWLFVLVVSLVMITVYPDYIAPLFDKFTPLPDGELKTKIEELAASIKFPLTKLYVVDGSKRSSHSNAYFYGFFKNKRIVLFDTLLENFEQVGDKTVVTDAEQVTDAATNAPSDVAGSEENKKSGKGCTDDEVVAVLSHELGHWYLNHVLKNFFIGQANILLCFIGLALLIQNRSLYEAFGFYDRQPTIIGLVVIFSYIFAPYNEVVGVLMTMLSRRFEFQADEFGKKLGHSVLLQSALVKLQKDNLAFPIVDWLYSMWTYSHPPLLERLKALKDKKSE